MELLYRGSRDGFKNSDFLRYCDSKGPTLTVIEDTNGCIFGGFTCQNWEIKYPLSRYASDDNAFLF